MERYFSKINTDLGLDNDVPAKQRIFYRGQWLKIWAQWNLLVKRSVEIIDKADEVTERAIDYDPVRLVEEISTLSGIEASITYLYVQAISFMPIYEVIHTLPKRQDYTEQDRAIFLKGHTAGQKSLGDELKAKKEVLRNRITSCQAILKAVKDDQ